MFSLAQTGTLKGGVQMPRQVRVRSHFRRSKGSFLPKITPVRAHSRTVGRKSSQNTGCPLAVLMLALAIGLTYFVGRML